MRQDQDNWDQIASVVDNYVGTVRNHLQELWERWPLDLSEKEMYEAVGALLARQVSLATHLALSPSAWNGHIGTLVLRSMTDAYITLAWILKDDSLARSIKLICTAHDFLDTVIAIFAPTCGSQRSTIGAPRPSVCVVF